MVKEVNILELRKLIKGNILTVFLKVTVNINGKMDHITKETLNKV